MIRFVLGIIWALNITGHASIDWVHLTLATIGGLILSLLLMAVGSYCRKYIADKEILAITAELDKGNDEHLHIVGMLVALYKKLSTK